jgi:sulfate/thiosulfate transport system ATP-binding protein
MINASDLTKSYGDFTALHDVTLDVPDGALVALLGPSGSGKSTLLRIVAGLEHPDAGTVLLHGEDVTALPARKRGIGFVFQHYAAFKHMSVRDNVAFGLSIRREKKDVIRERVDELLEIVGLAGWADRLPAQLSGGQRQRMALARALAVRPRVLLLDEPFAGLSSEERSDVLALVTTIPRDVTIVMIEHDMDVALDFAERITVLHFGRVVVEGTRAEVVADPRTREIYLGE